LPFEVAVTVMVDGKEFDERFSGQIHGDGEYQFRDEF
jgi:hypothetical protein